MTRNECSTLALLGFDLFNLAPGFVKGAALTQLLVSTASCRDLPDHLPTFMFRPPLDTCVTGVSTDNVIVTVQQMSNLRQVSHVGGGAMDMVYQTRFSVGSDMRFHAEEVLVSLLRLVHFRVALAFLVLGRIGRG